MRKQNGMGDEIFPRGGRYEEVAENLKARNVRVRDRRCIICLNDEETRKDEVVCSAGDIVPAWSSSTPWKKDFHSPVNSNA
jgi:hypothetical protein